MPGLLLFLDDGRLEIGPLAWLSDVLKRLVCGSTKSHQLEQLLPWNWRPPDAADTVPVAEAA